MGLKLFELFVYGTLKRGFWLHHNLKDGRYLGRSSITGFDLYYFPLGGYPILYRNMDSKEKIWGEVYLINKQILNRVRWIELGAGYKEGFYNGMIFYYKTEKDFEREKDKVIKIPEFTKEVIWNLEKNLK